MPPWPTAPAPPPPGQAGFPLPPAQRPLGVTLVAVWSLAAGPICAIVGLLLLVLGPSMVNDPAFQAQLPPEVRAEFTTGALAGVIAVLGLLLFVIGAAMPVAGYGIYYVKPWGWGLMVAVTVGWLLLGVFTIPSGLVTIAVAGFLLWYFTRPGVKRWLGKEQATPGLPDYVPPPPMPPS
jgi:hypothetical protein